MNALEANDIDKAKELAVRYSPHSIVARQVLLDNTSEILPDVHFEVSWLLEKIVEEFDILTSILESNPRDMRSKKELRETMWTLAALLHSPPDKNEERILSIIGDLGIGEEIASMAGHFQTIEHFETANH